MTEPCRVSCDLARFIAQQGAHVESYDAPCCEECGARLSERDIERERDWCYGCLYTCEWREDGAVCGKPAVEGGEACCCAMHELQGWRDVLATTLKDANNPPDIWDLEMARVARQEIERWEKEVSNG